MVFLAKCQKMLDLLEKTLDSLAVSSKTKEKIMAFQLKFDFIWATNQNFLEMLTEYSSEKYAV